MERFSRVIKAIAYALYFRDSGKPYFGDWIIHSTSLVSMNLADNPFMKGMRELLQKSPFVEKPAPSPSVFKYSEFVDSKGGIIYRFEFYEGFIVHAIMPA